MSAPAKPPSPQEFLRAISQRWLALMSGALSVPFGALSLWVSTDSQKAAWGLLALVAAVFTIYLIWAAEREKRNDAESKLDLLLSRPKPDITCELETVITGNPGGDRRLTMICLLLTFKNKGAASAVDKFWLEIVDPLGNAFNPYMRFITNNSEFHTNDGNSLVLTEEDNIQNKLIKPIETGGLIRGWAMMITDRVTLAEVHDCRVRIHGEDVWGQAIELDQNFRGDVDGIIFPAFGRVPKPAERPVASWGYSASYRHS